MAGRPLYRSWRSWGVVATLGAVLVAAGSSGCDWYRTWRLDRIRQSAGEEVERWTRNSQLPRVDPSSTLEGPADITTVVTPNRVALHNLGAVDAQRKHAAENDAAGISPKTFRNDWIRMRTGLDFDPDARDDWKVPELEEAYGAGEEALRNMREHTDTSAGDGRLHLMHVDRRVAYRKVAAVLVNAGRLGAGTIRFRVESEGPDERAVLRVYTPGLCSAAPCTDTTERPICLSPVVRITERGLYVRLNQRRVPPPPPVPTEVFESPTERDPDGQGAPSAEEESDAPQKPRRDGERSVREWDGRVLRSDAGECPTVPESSEPSDKLVRTLNRAAEQVRPCERADIQPESNVAWERVAHVISAMRHRTPFKKVVPTLPPEHPRGKPPTCDETVRIEDLATD